MKWPQKGTENMKDGAGETTANHAKYAKGLLRRFIAVETGVDRDKPT
jgi:hypothetical protein